MKFCASLLAIVITGDGSQIYDYDLEMKQQSFQLEKFIHTKTEKCETGEEQSQEHTTLTYTVTA
jgi:hypothetical protein